jgi:hypothetical protein
MNFSQEVIQEFQLSSANFDLSTGITSVGAVNIVTRSGGNDLRGSAISSIAITTWRRTLGCGATR